MTAAQDDETQRAAPGAYYRVLGPGRFRSSAAASGAWDPAHQHMSPVAGLLVDALERCAPREGMALSRVCFDILGVIEGGEVAVTAQVVRPGRSIELLRAELAVRGRTAVRASAWRLAAPRTSGFAGTSIEPMPGPDAGAPFTPADIWGGGYIRSLQLRVLPGWEPGRGRVWLRSTVDLVEGAPTSSLAAMFALVDTANGVSVRAHPRDLLFPNIDLTVHLFRAPHGEWLGLATEVSFGADGVGLTAAVLHDLDGPFGRSAQILTLRRP